MKWADCRYDVMYTLRITVHAFKKLKVLYSCQLAVSCFLKLFSLFFVVVTSAVFHGE